MREPQAAEAGRRDAAPDLIGERVAGEELRVDSAMWFAVAGGRILRQETYDCAHPPRGATRPSP